MVVVIVLALTAQVRAESQERKSPNVATALAYAGAFAAPALSLVNFTLEMETPRERRIGYTLIGVESVLMVLGPSAGHWYTGRFTSPGLGIRAGGVAVLATGFVGLVHCVSPDVDCGRRDWESYATVGLLTIGTTGVILGTLLDTTDASRAARRWNREHGVEAVIAPTVTPSGAGLAVAGRF
ncbi:MAG: hypothetical protein H0T46_04950 [Deltaproteobacteria bacterium]|nr:hypothetical protein [Deltaproteobacteria bacterium]